MCIPKSYWSQLRLIVPAKELTKSIAIRRIEPIKRLNVSLHKVNQTDESPGRGPSEVVIPARW